MYMDNFSLKNILYQNPQIIVTVLEYLNAHHINLVENKRIQFGLPENHSGRSHCIFLDKYLTHKDYPNGISEDFISMVARLKNISYDMSCNLIMMFNNGQSLFFNKNDDDSSNWDKPLGEYDISLLDNYNKVISELFLKDGIPPSTQNKFGIRYSELYNRILIPIFQKGKLVGLFGRYNEKNITNENIPKYFPILPYLKGKVLFPYDINSPYVRQSKWCFLVESEKTPMLCDKWGWRNIFALGGNVVKQPQIDLLKELGVEKIILSLDKGLEAGFIEFSAIRLKEQGFNVYYIDVDKIPYLPDKECVFDLNNKELIKKTIQEYLKEV